MLYLSLSVSKTPTEVRLLKNVLSLQVGEWRFEILNLASEEQHVTVSVQSEARNEGDEPIVTNARWGLENVTPPDNQMLYVTVAKGKLTWDKGVMLLDHMWALKWILKQQLNKVFIPII